MNLITKNKLVFIKVSENDIYSNGFFTHPKLDELTESGWKIKEIDRDAKTLEKNATTIIYKIILEKPDYTSKVVVEEKLNELKLYLETKNRESENKFEKMNENYNKLLKEEKEVV